MFRLRSIIPEPRPTATPQRRPAVGVIPSPNGDNSSRRGSMLLGEGTSSPGPPTRRSLTTRTTPARNEANPRLRETKPIRAGRKRTQSRRKSFWPGGWGRAGAGHPRHSQGGRRANDTGAKRTQIRAQGKRTQFRRKSLRGFDVHRRQVAPDGRPSPISGPEKSPQISNCPELAGGVDCRRAGSKTRSAQPMRRASSSAIGPQLFRGVVSWRRWSISERQGCSKASGW